MMFMSVLLPELTDRDYELFHYETHPKIQMRIIPEKGQRQYRLKKILMRTGKLVNNDGHNHIRRSTIMQHQMNIHI